MINLWAYSGWTAAGPWNPTAPNARVFEYVTETQRTGEWKARRGTTEIGRCTTSRDPFPFSMNEPWFVQPRHNVQTPYFYSRDASSSINGSRPCRDSLTPKRRPCNLSHLCEIFVHSLTTIFWEISEKTYIYIRGRSKEILKIRMIICCECYWELNTVIIVILLLEVLCTFYDCYKGSKLYMWWLFYWYVLCRIFYVIQNQCKNRYSKQNRYFHWYYSCCTIIGSKSRKSVM